MNISSRHSKLDYKNFIFFLFFWFLQITGIYYTQFDGFQSWRNLFIVLLFSFFSSFILYHIFCKFFLSLKNFFFKRINRINHKSIHIHLIDNQFFTFFIIFLLQIPVFLAFYPGIVYYDIDVQIHQYETSFFIQNHPLIHTLFVGFCKNLFREINNGYAISIIIQMIIMDIAMSYAVSYVNKKTNSSFYSILCLLFYSLFPLNTLLTISTTKDVLFAAFVLIFYVDNLHFFIDRKRQLTFICRMIINAVLMILMRNNAFYALISTLFILFFITIRHHGIIKKYFIVAITICFLYLIVNSAIVSMLHAVPGSIKEMMSIPVQQQARLFLHTDSLETKAKIKSYILEPERYKYYISDPVKEQLDFDTLDSQCKHFLLDTVFFDIKNPVTAIDATLYNTQGFWDLFHSPYQSDHFFLAPIQYRGGATLCSKIPFINHLYTSFFFTTDLYHGHFIIIFLNCALYVWIFLYMLYKAMRKKNKPLLYSGLFPFFYLLTLLLGPSAIIRYCFPIIIMSPICLLYLIKLNHSFTLFIE